MFASCKAYFYHAFQACLAILSFWLLNCFEANVHVERQCCRHLSAKKCPKKAARLRCAPNFFTCLGAMLSLVASCWAVVPLPVPESAIFPGYHCRKCGTLSASLVPPDPLGWGLVDFFEKVKEKTKLWGSKSESR